MYRIRDWETHFENNRTTDMVSMKWVPFPNRHDGDGITELLDHPNGVAHFGAWVLIVQVASKCGKPAGRCGGGETPRGTLRRENGKPHDVASIARITGADRKVLEEAIPRLLEIKWLEIIPDDALTCENPQAPAVSPQGPATIPQEGDDRARAPVPFPSSSSSRDGGPGEGKTWTPATQSHADRALEVLRLYPSKAKKDGRLVVKDIAAQNILAARIAKHPNYPWEEHAALEGQNTTPKNAATWAERMPDPVALEALRKAATPAATTTRRQL